MSNIFLNYIDYEILRMLRSGRIGADCTLVSELSTNTPKYKKL